MPMDLTDSQRSRRDEFAAFAAHDVAPFVADWDRTQRIPTPVIEKLGAAGYLGSSIPRVHGGQGWDWITFGLLNEALGRVSSALTGVLTVQTMVSMSILKWGTLAQVRDWLRPLAEGRAIAGFALTEPGAGSALNSLATRFTATPGGLVLNGTKRWISCGQFADLFLVFGMLGKQPVACIVPWDAPGVRVEPIRDLMAFRAAGLAQIHFQDVAVPAANIVGKPGFALSHVAQVGLHFGRLSTACSALGLLRGCFEESTAYAGARRIGATALGDLGMIRALVARMGTDLEAAQALCFQACRSCDGHLPEAFERTLIAKYFTSRAAVRSASDAVQIHGASGCHESSAVSRFYRDAKIMEVIEGTTQVHEDLLGQIFIGRGAALAGSTQIQANDHDSPVADPRAAGRSREDRPVQQHGSPVSG